VVPAQDWAHRSYILFFPSHIRPLCGIVYTAPRIAKVGERRMQCLKGVPMRWESVPVRGECVLRRCWRVGAAGVGCGPAFPKGALRDARTVSRDRSRRRARGPAGGRALATVADAASAVPGELSGSPHRPAHNSAGSTPAGAVRGCYGRALARLRLVVEYAVGCSSRSANTGRASSRDLPATAILSI